MMIEPERLHGRLVDLDTGKAVPGMIRYDATAGIVEAYQTVGGNWEQFDGYLVLVGARVKVDGDGNALTYTASGRFRLERAGRRHGPSPSAGTAGLAGAGLAAAACSLCGSTLVLLGDDLCPTCRASQSGQRNRLRVERLINPLAAHKCQWRSASGQTCGREANFSVADEVIVSPASTASPLLLPGGRRLAKPLWERGATVGRHWYCAWHWSPPRILDARGEVVQRLAEDPVQPN